MSKSLSRSKLEDFLYNNKFEPVSYYCIKNSCFMFEIIQTETSQSFFVYIPSIYNFIIEKSTDDIPVYNLNELKIDFDPNFVEDENHKENPIYLAGDNDKLENVLEYNYKKNIELRNIPKQDILTIKEIYRQLKRLRNVVENIEYKLCIFYKNFLIIIRRDCITIDFYTINGIQETSFKKLGIVSDLEVLYKKRNKIIDDVFIVKNNIYNILQKNQGLHAQILTEMFKPHKDILSIGQKMDNNILMIDNNINKLQQLINTLNEEENKIYSEIESQKILEKPNLISNVKFENELLKLQHLKQELITKLRELQSKKENILLSFDNIFFDNTIMIDLIIKNFNKLKFFS